jgi:hypothetical protein
MTLGLLDVERPDLAATTTLEAVGPWRRAAGRLIDMVVREVAVGIGTAGALFASAIAAGLLGRGPAVSAAVERLTSQLEKWLVPRTFSLDGLTGVLALGARAATVVVHVPAAPGGGPGYPDRSVEIVAALFPATNEEAPSATDSVFLSLTP